jgi:ABC-type glycerol-3-phosphate transport system substrate-binding protein
MATQDPTRGSSMDRRAFLRRLGVTATALAATGLLQACSGGAPAAPAKTESKPAESSPAATKPAETKPAASPAASPGASPAASPSPAAAGQTSAAVSGMPTQNLTLAFWNGLTGPDGQIMEKLTGQFMAEFPNIKVEQQQIQWNDFYTKILTAIPAGEGPDMALMHHYEIPRFADAKHVTQITADELKAQQLDQSDYYEIA